MGEMVDKEGMELEVPMTSLLDGRGTREVGEETLSLSIEVAFSWLSSSKKSGCPKAKVHHEGDSSG